MHICSFHIVNVFPGMKITNTQQMYVVNTQLENRCQEQLKRVRFSVLIMHIINGDLLD